MFFMHAFFFNLFFFSTSARKRKGGEKKGARERRKGSGPRKLWVHYPANCTPQWLELTGILGCDPTAVHFHFSPFISHYGLANGGKVADRSCTSSCFFLFLRRQTRLSAQIRRPLLFPPPLKPKWLRFQFNNSKQSVEKLIKSSRLRCVLFLSLCDRRRRYRSDGFNSRASRIRKQISRRGRILTIEPHRVGKGCQPRGVVRVLINWPENVFSPCDRLPVLWHKDWQITNKIEF